MPAFAKHTTRPIALTIGYAVGLVVIAWVMKASTLERKNQRVTRLWLVLCVALALANAIVYPGTRIPDAHSTAPDALIEPAQRLLDGVYPYAKTLYDGAPASPGPAWIAVHAPLTSLGLIWLVVPIHLGLAAYMVSRASPSNATPFAVFVLALLAFVQMSVVGHDLFAVGCAMVAVTLGVYEQTSKSTRSWMIWGIAAGAVATARAPLLVFVAALTVLAVRSNPRVGAKFAIVAGSVALTTHAAVYLWGNSLGLYYQPFHVFGRAAGGAGIPAITVGAALVLAVSVVVWLRGTTSVTGWLCFVWATAGLPFVAVGLAERLTLSHLGWSGWEGKIYAGFGIPLLVAAMLLNSEPSQRRRFKEGFARTFMRGSEQRFEFERRFR